MSESDVITYAHPSDAHNFRVGMRLGLEAWIPAGHDPEFEPPSQVTAFGGMKVFSNPSVPKNHAYLIPANIADYLNVDSDE